MQQFNVHKIGPEIKIAGIDLSFTNASLFMVISASVIMIFLFLGTKEKKIIPDKVQLIAEMFYSFVAKMISDTAGSKAKPYFSFIFSLFSSYCFLDEPNGLFFRFGRSPNSSKILLRFFLLTFNSLHNIFLLTLFLTDLIK